MGRGANWTSADDVQLCKSWLHTSTDPIVGTSQKSNSFWVKTLEHIRTSNIETLKQNPNCQISAMRTQRSTQSRFHAISAAVAKFAGVHSQQQRNAASGTNETDVERAALEVYRSQHPDAKSFDHRECWIVLKQHEKWASTGSEPLFEPSLHVPISEEPTTPSQPGTPSYMGFREPERARPIGVKRAKAELQQSRVILRQLEVAEKANAMAAKRQRIMQQSVALSYLKLDISQVPIDMRDIFVSTRNGLLNDLSQTEQEIPPNAGNEDLDASSPMPDMRAEDNNSPGLEGDGDEDHTYQDHSHGFFMPKAGLANLHAAGPSATNQTAYFQAAGPSSTNHTSYVELDEYDLRIGM